MFKALKISTWTVNPCANVGLTKTGLSLQFTVSGGVFTRNCKVDNKDMKCQQSMETFLIVFNLHVKNNFK